MGGFDYTNQTEMLQDMNQALVGMMQGVQEQNQALLYQLIGVGSTEAMSQNSKKQ